MENRLKSIYINVFIFYGLAIIIYALTQVSKHGFSIAWVSVTLSGLLLSGFIGSLFIIDFPRTKRSLPLWTLLIGLCVLAAAWGLGQDGGTSLPIILAAIGFGSWLVYLYWYSVYPKRTKNLLRLGAQLPNFTIENIAKEKIEASSFQGSKTLWMFYRGNWCPICMAQIREIAAQYRELADRGLKIVMVSPQPHGHTRALAKKFDLPFSFLVDPENRAAKQLNIHHTHGLPTGLQVLGYDSDTVMPTVIITDENNQIIFADLTDNYRVRPEPATFLKVLDEYAQSSVV